MPDRDIHRHGCGCTTCRHRHTQVRDIAKALAPLLTALTPDTPWQAAKPDTIDTSSRRARLTTADGQQLTIHHFDGKPDRIIVLGGVTGDLFRHQPHPANGMTITLGTHRSHEAMSREIGRRLLPAVAEWTATVRAQAEADTVLMNTLLNHTDGLAEHCRPGYSRYPHTDISNWFTVTAYERHADELSFAVGFKPTDHNFVRIEAFVPRHHAASLISDLARRARDLNAPVEPDLPG